MHINAVAGIMRSHRIGHNLYTPKMLSWEDIRSNMFGDVFHREATYRIIKIGTEEHLVEKLELLLLPNSIGFLTNTSLTLIDSGEMLSSLLG